MRNQQLLGGHAALATSATMPSHLWFCAVEDAVIALGVSGDWLRETTQRARLNRYHSAGEPVWMAADSMLWFWRGRQLAALADQDGLAHIRAAARSAKGGA